jgi:hypothetical protein
MSRDGIGHCNHRTIRFVLLLPALGGHSMGLSLCPLSGVKRTWAEHHCDVCFWPKANSSSIFPGQCPLLAQSGNWASRNGSRLNRYDWFVLSLWGRQCDDAISAAVWPLAARAQQFEHMRRIGMLMGAAVETDQQTGVAVFKEILHQLGWIDGRNAG